eukprot:1090561-Prymnesium_polylepis.3
MPALTSVPHEIRDPALVSIASSASKDALVSYSHTLGELRAPEVVCALPDGTLCVADRGEDAGDGTLTRLRVVTPRGKLVRMVVPPKSAVPWPSAMCADERFLYVVSFDTIAKLRLPDGAQVARYSVWSEAAAADQPRALRKIDGMLPVFGGAVAIGDSLYVADANGGRILVFSTADADLGYRRAFGKQGYRDPDPECPVEGAPPLQPDEFLSPRAVAAHPDGIVVVDEEVRPTLRNPTLPPPTGWPLLRRPGPSGRRAA